MRFGAAPMRFTGNTGLVNNLVASAGNTGTIGGSPPLVDWVKIGNVGKNAVKVCAVVGGRVLTGLGALVIPTSTSRCADYRGPNVEPYPECVGIYNKKDNLDDFVIPGEDIDAPGQCTRIQLDKLQSDKNKACGKPRSCKAQRDTCAVIKQNIKNGEACAQARFKLNSLCFKGETKLTYVRSLKLLILYKPVSRLLCMKKNLPVQDFNK